MARHDTWIPPRTLAMGTRLAVRTNNEVVRTVTVAELIKLLQEYPDQNQTIKLIHFENGEEDPVGLEDQKCYVNCTHYPKFDERGLPVKGTGTYEHNKSCRLETHCVALI